MGEREAMAEGTAASVTYELVRTNTLDDAAREALFAEILEVDCAAYEREPIEQYWRARSDFFTSNRSISLARSDGHLVGFGAYALWDMDGQPVKYHDVTAIHPGYRRLGVATKVVQNMTSEVLAEGYAGFYITCRTQNPAVAQAWCKNYHFMEMTVFPFTDPATPWPEDVVTVAELVSRQLTPGAAFDRSTLVQRAGYAGAGTRVSPTDASQASEEVAGFFARHVDIAGGDAVIIVIPFGAVPLQSS